MGGKGFERERERNVRVLIGGRKNGFGKIQGETGLVEQ